MGIISAHANADEKANRVMLPARSPPDDKREPRVTKDPRVFHCPLLLVYPFASLLGNFPFDYAKNCVGERARELVASRSI